MKTFEGKIEQAIQRRLKLTQVCNAMRLANGAGDDLDGLLIDRYHKHLHVQILADRWYPQKDILCRFLATRMPVDYLIVKIRQGLDIKAEVLIGAEPRTIVEEHGLKFEVNLNDGLNCGLFLDMRHNRWMVAQASKHKKVLNCFSYTCSFGVYAKSSGAAQVINTDISRKILDRGKQNYQLNGLSIADAEFIKADSMAYLQRAFKKGNTFDVIILDPPSFARHEGKVFQVKRDLPKLIALAVAALNPGGSLLVATNNSEMAHADLERILAKGLNGRRVSNLQRVTQDEDFVGSNSFKESHLVGLWAKFL
jgi:23S rRNA (cytosine1962-C5)-methyltransferase